MGRRTVEARLYGSVSRNNDERDDQDRAEWVNFLAEVKEIATRPEYANLEIQISDEGTY